MIHIWRTHAPVSMVTSLLIYWENRPCPLGCVFARAADFECLESQLCAARTVDMQPPKRQTEVQGSATCKAPRREGAGRSLPCSGCSPCLAHRPHCVRVFPERGLDLSFAWSKAQPPGFPLAWCRLSAGFWVLRGHHVPLWLLGFWTPLGGIQRWLPVLTARKGVNVFLERSHTL